MGQSSTGSIEVIPTGAALGADIIGIDLSANIDDAAFQDIYTAWNDNLVLRFRGQRLDDDALVAFSRRFGELDMAPTPAPGERMAARLPEVAVISNIVVGGKAVGSLGNSELVWHQDMSYNELLAIGGADGRDRALEVFVVLTVLRKAARHWRTVRQASISAPYPRFSVLPMIASVAKSGPNASPLSIPRRLASLMRARLARLLTVPTAQ